jgi:uncharacterized protein (TIGR03437 family)
MVAWGQTPAPLTINSPAFPTGIVGNTYGVIASGTNLSFPSIPRFTAAGGTAPYSFAIVSGSLPSGLSLNGATGQIVGTPSSTTSGTVIQVEVRDARGNTARTQAGAINVTLPPTLSFAGNVGASFRAPTRCGVTGSTTQFTYSVSISGGFSVEQSTGNVIGEPFADGTQSGSFTCTAPTFVFQWFLSIRVDPMPEFGLNPSEVGRDFNFTPTGFPAGTPPFSFRIVGGTLAPGLSLNSSTGAVTGKLTASGSFQWDLRRVEGNGAFRTFRYRLRVNEGGKLSVSQSTVDVTVQQGSTDPVVASFLVEGQRIFFETKLGTLTDFNLDREKIRISPTTATTPSAVTVRIDASSLSVGQYSILVELYQSNGFQAAAKPDVTVTVRLNVIDKSPKLEVSPPVISYSFPYGIKKDYRFNITVKNSGGGKFVTQGRVDIYLGGGWVSLVGSGTELGPGESRQYTAIFTPGSLEPGTYSADAFISAPQQPTIPVRLVANIPKPIPQIVLEGVPEVITMRKSSPSRSVKVTLKNATPDDRWTLSRTEPKDGPVWYRISPASGKSGDSFQVIFQPSALPPTKNFEADAVEVRVGDAARRGKAIAMQIVPYSPPIPFPDYIALGSRIRNVVREGGNRSFDIWPQSNENSTYITTIASSPNSNTGEPFFDVSPANGTVAGITNPDEVPKTVQILVRQLDRTISLPGFYAGVVVFGFRNAEDPQSKEFFAPVKVVQQMGSIFNPNPPPDLPDPNAGNGLFTPAPEDDDKEKCNPDQMVVISNLPPTLNVSTGSAVRIHATVMTGCGVPVTTGTVMARFSNGDPDLTLVHDNEGVWRGTWIPRNQIDTAAISIIAENDGKKGSEDAAAVMAPSPGLPIVESGGIRHGASQETTGEVAPGMRITLRGSEFLAGDPVEAAAGESPTELGGVSVFLGATRLPLARVSSTRIEAIIPAEALPESDFELAIRSAEGRLSAGETVQAVAARPGVFLKEGSASQGEIFTLSGSDRVRAEGDAAAAKGSSVIITASGLGLLNAEGKLAVPVRVLFGDLLAEATPDAVSLVKPGVYEIAVKVPAEAPTGAEVPVVLDSAGMRSRPVIMSIR